MTKKILVGVDDSQSAAEAAHKAAEVAVALNAQLHVVTAYGKQEVETVEIGRETFFISTEEQALELAQTVAVRLTADFPELDVRCSALDGKPAVAIVDVATANRFDLIVVGNRRVQGPSRVLGSIATAILHKAPCDVYVVHTH